MARVKLSPGFGTARVDKNLYIGEGSSDTSAAYGIVYRRYAPNESSGLYNRHIIRVKPSADPSASGDPVIMDSGALMIIGGGEFAYNYFTANPHDFALTSEHMILGADGKVIVASNGNTIANAKEWEFNTAGNLICPESGNIRTQKGNIWIQRDDVENTETTRSVSVYQNFGFKDKNDDYYAFVQGAAYTDGRKGVSITARANDGSSNVDNGLALLVKPDGTRAVSVSSAAAWRAAIVPGFGAYTESDISTAVSVATSTAKTIASVKLAAGHYIASYSAIFASNATGRRWVGLSTETNTTPAGNMNRQTIQSRPADSGGSSYVHACCILAPTSETTYYLIAWQNSGSALNVTGSLRTIRIN